MTGKREDRTVIYVRLPPEQYRQVVERAARAGCKPPEYIRRLILRDLLPTPTLSTPRWFPPETKA